MMIKAQMAAAMVLAVVLTGCNQPPPQQMDTSQQGGGGYGPFDTGNGQNNPPPNNGFQDGGMGGGGGAEAVVSGGGASAPPEFQALVVGYLDRYATQMAAGWPRVDGVPDTVVGLQPNGEHRLQVRLRGGRSYGFIGACDNECSNIDFILEDGSGAVVTQDVLDDDYPLVEVTPQTDSVYTLRIQLKTCTVGPCYVAARLVARP